MIEDRDDPIIDSLLDEVLGGQRPPDLSDRIMHLRVARGGAAAAGQAAGASPVPLPSSTPAATPGRDVSSLLPPAVMGVTADPPLQEPPVQGPPVAEPPVQRPSRPTPRRAAADGQSSRWISYGVAAAVLLMATALGLVAARIYFGQPTGEGMMAERSGDGPADLVGPEDGRLSPRVPRDSSLADRSGTGQPRRLVAAPHAEILATVNHSIERKWVEAGVAPAPPATDDEWVRRAHVRMLGRIPTIEEVEAFEQDDREPPQRKAELLEELVAADEFAEEHARTWTTYWVNVLIGRTGGTQDGSWVNREGLQAYLRQSLLENKPFDELAYELISATGSNDPQSDDFNGATNFVLSGLENDGVLAASKTSRILMGCQLQCAQCHDHPFNDQLKQERFWELVAFFRQSEIERNGPVIRLVDRDAFGQTGNPGEAGVAFHSHSGTSSVAFPVFADGTELPRSGRLEDANRRSELARLVVSSPDFSRAIVNRTWAHILGRGFTSPIDDMGPHNEPSHPELLNYMADQFAAHDYDFKSLVRWIALSDVYSLSSQITDGNRADDPEITKAPLFSRYYARPMQPEEVYESLLALAGPQAAPADFEAQEAAKLQWLGQFTIDLQTDDGSELSIFDTSYTQKLEMLGGELMQQATDPENTDGILHRVIHGSLSREKKIEHLFLASLARRPTEEEAAAASQVVDDRPGDADRALEDIWWALLNSSEFLLDH